MQLGQPHHLGALDLKPRQGGGKADRLGQPMFGQAAAARAFQIGMQDEGPGRTGCSFIGVYPAVFRQRVKLLVFLGKIGNQSSPS